MDGHRVNVNTTPPSPYSATVIQPQNQNGSMTRQNSRELIIDDMTSKSVPNSGGNKKLETTVHETPCAIHWNRCRRPIIHPSWHFYCSTMPSSHTSRIDRKIIRLQQACCDVWNILTDAVWAPESHPSPPSTDVEVIPQEIKSETEVPPVWKPAQRSLSQEKLQFRSVKIDLPTSPQPNTAANVHQETVVTSPSVTENQTPPYVPPVSCPQPSPSNPGIVSASLPSSSSPTQSTVPTLPPSSFSSSQSTVPKLETIEPTFMKISSSGSGLPPYQDPTITLLQRARERRTQQGAIYIDHKMNSKEEQPYPKLAKESSWWEPQFSVKSEEVLGDRKVTHLEPVKFDGIGPVIQGVPISLCTGVKEENKADWYKRMYKTLHKSHDPDGRLPYSSRGGYVSEPEPERDDDFYYRRTSRRKPRDDYNESEFRNGANSKKPALWNPPSTKYRSDIYRNQPKKIEDYEPGRSSLAEMEAKMHGGRDTIRPGYSSQSYMFKDGYESDSTLVYRKRGQPSSLSPSEQRAWYKEFQKGGDIPIAGFRRTTPTKPVEPPHRYQASEVNIHYRSPIQHLEKEYITEEEIKKRQELAMKQFYEEERRKKALQEMEDIDNRRHSDNFIPSQKSPIPLNRYDNLFEERSLSPQRTRTPEPKTAARALYNFTAQNSRELSFNKDDIIFIHRKIDKNWYEGEHHGLIGLLPVNHVEIIQYDSARLTAKKPTEGQARAKYSFQAQTPMELSLVKGEHIILTRKVDSNWYEGHIGPLKGIFPASYVEVLREPLPDLSGSSHSPLSRPTASPVSHSLIMNGSVVSPRYNTLPYSYSDNQRLITESSSHAPMRRSAPARPPVPFYEDKKHPLNETLHIHTQSDPIQYRALYAYKPQNDDELELREGDVVYVMEKCDDGWYVGTSHRTGLFGTFPGNYVERI